MANKLFKSKRKDSYLSASNATRALQVANVKRHEFFLLYGPFGQTAAPEGIYNSVEELAKAEHHAAR